MSLHPLTKLSVSGSRFGLLLPLLAASSALFGLLLFGVPPLSAQATATLRGTVADPSGAAIAGAGVTLMNRLNGFERQAATDPSGSFTFTNVPFQDYELIVEHAGFKTYRRTVGLRSNIPVDVEIQLGLADQVQSVSVSAVETATLVDTQATGTRNELNFKTMERMPVQVGARGLESMLLSFPGFAANANGAIHPRGAHNQMTYVVDGMPISDQFTGSFATSIDPSIVQTVELYTGDIPPQFGNKISGVANITTRSGLGSGRKFFANTQLGGAEFNTLSNTTQFGGEAGRFGYFTSISTLKSHRFLDQVSLDNLHNGGNSQRGFTRLDYQPNDRDFFRFNILSGRSSFELANLRSQHAAGQQQRRELRDLSLSLGYLRTISPSATWDSTVSYRTSIAELFPSPGDTPVSADAARHLSTLTVANRLNLMRGRHQLQLGVDWQHFPMSENFSFLITDPAFNAPGSEEFNPSLVSFDRTRGGGWFRFSGKDSGNLYTGFIQDKITVGRFLFDLGFRSSATTNTAFSWTATSSSRASDSPTTSRKRGRCCGLLTTATTRRRPTRISCFQTPRKPRTWRRPAFAAPWAGGSSASARSGRTSTKPDCNKRSAAGRASTPSSTTRTRRTCRTTTTSSTPFYHKDSTDLQDNDNFFNTGIIFPTSLAQSNVNGVEARFVVPENSTGFSGTLSLTHYHVIVTPPFTGGVFLGNAAVEALSEGPFVIDHDQELGLHGTLLYRLGRNMWTSWSVRHDSGLVSNPSDPAEVAADPDFADLLPLVDLESGPPRVNPRTIIDFAIGYEHLKGDSRQWELMFQVSNLTDKDALFNFQSVFVGTRLVQPRTVGVRWKYYW